MRRLALTRQKKLEPINRKVERRDQRREKKALRVARVERTVEQELLDRLRTSISQKEIYNIDQSAFENALSAEEVEEDIEDTSEVETSEDELVYTSASEEEIEDLVETETNLILAEHSKRRKISIKYESGDDD
ncbi:uncharacterized protein DEA37_0005979 [Paragonimus westermani]|uniref:Uncharacterized protein n=1 Tax=Paragonimus westermani TaxID=34504 RepID=A0A5J4N7P1_9TREM|nr:uncharacterized protein DEA37_0005977 [Paragonimus westermani]KAA3671568.1 uncharacterized protein DEA37_0005979 [Paragonimus westermani]